MLRIHHVDLDPDPTHPFDADADPDFLFDADPDPVPSFQIKSQTLDKLLKSVHIPYILACHLQNDADPDPAYHFDADSDPGSQNEADPGPQHYRYLTILLAFA